MVGGNIMNEFQTWVLGVLEQIPEINISIPKFVYQFLKDLVILMDCFIVYNDFVPVLSASVFFSAINLSITLLDYILSFRKSRVKKI